MTPTRSAREAGRTAAWIFASVLCFFAAPASGAAQGAAKPVIVLPPASGPVLVVEDPAWVSDAVEGPAEVIIEQPTWLEERPALFDADAVRESRQRLLAEERELREVERAMQREERAMQREAQREARRQERARRRRDRARGPGIVAPMLITLVGSGLTVAGAIASWVSISTDYCEPTSGSIYDLCAGRPTMGATSIGLLTATSASLLGVVAGAIWWGVNASKRRAARSGHEEIVFAPIAEVTPTLGGEASSVTLGVRVMGAF